MLRRAVRPDPASVEYRVGLVRGPWPPGEPRETRRSPARSSTTRSYAEGRATQPGPGGPAPCGPRDACWSRRGRHRRVPAGRRPGAVLRELASRLRDGARAHSARFEAGIAGRVQDAGNWGITENQRCAASDESATLRFMPADEPARRWRNTFPGDYALVFKHIRPQPPPTTPIGLYMEVVAVREFGSSWLLSAGSLSMAIIAMYFLAGSSRRRSANGSCSASP